MSLEMSVMEIEYRMVMNVNVNVHDLEFKLELLLCFYTKLREQG